MILLSVLPSFMNRAHEAFSTEPVKNNLKGAPLNFYHVQNVSETGEREGDGERDANVDPTSSIFRSLFP